MKTRTAFAALSVTAVAALGVAGPASAAQGGQSKTCDNTTAKDTITYFGPNSLWPPNHKMVNLPFTATTDSLTASQEASDLVVTVTHNEYYDSGEEFNGSGHTLTDGTTGTGHSDDASKGVNAIAQARAERAGTGTGRIYTAHAVATFSTIGGMVPTRTCTQDFTVTVPHDQGNHSGSTKASRRSARLRRAR